ncbi:MAG: hypothetical protein KDI61_01870 [Alphaproteobacteria bacterium]|nr:hypothetical protein [Alphaproteobacteria bacterium]MCB1838996.1 hypothetical protein [Alphaproteobacteria bacterium]
MDTIFGDGSPGSGTPEPMQTVGRFFDAGIAVGAMNAVLDTVGNMAEVISNSPAGGINLGGGADVGPVAQANFNFSAPVV